MQPLPLFISRTDHLPKLCTLWTITSYSASSQEEPSWNRDRTLVSYIRRWLFTIEPLGKPLIVVVIYISLMISDVDHFFPCAYLLATCIPLRESLQILCPFWTGFFIFNFWAVLVLHILWILIVIRKYNSQVFVLTMWFAFSLGW